MKRSNKVPQQNALLDIAPVDTKIKAGREQKRFVGQVTHALRTAGGVSMQGKESDTKTQMQTPAQDKHYRKRTRKSANTR